MTLDYCKLHPRSNKLTPKSFVLMDFCHISIKNHCLRSRYGCCQENTESGSSSTKLRRTKSAFALSQENNSSFSCFLGVSLMFPSILILYGGCISYQKVIKTVLEEFSVLCKLNSINFWLTSNKILKITNLMLSRGGKRTLLCRRIFRGQQTRATYHHWFTIRKIQWMQITENNSYIAVG